jgi:putative ABC transport system substrate-binding protein
VTGVTHFASQLEGKRFGLLREMVPAADPIAALINPSRSAAPMQAAEVSEAAARAQARLLVVNAAAEADFDRAFASLVEQHAGALLVCADPFFFSRRHKLVELAAHHRVPAMYEWRDFPVAGGLMSYAFSRVRGQPICR